MSWPNGSRHRPRGSPCWAKIVRVVVRERCTKPSEISLKLSLFALILLALVVQRGKRHPETVLT